MPAVPAVSDAESSQMMNKGSSEQVVRRIFIAKPSAELIKRLRDTGGDVASRRLMAINAACLHS